MRLLRFLMTLWKNNGEAHSFNIVARTVTITVIPSCLIRIFESRNVKFIAFASSRLFYFNLISMGIKGVVTILGCFGSSKDRKKQKANNSTHKKGVKISSSSISGHATISLTLKMGLINILT